VRRDSIIIKVSLSFTFYLFILYFPDEDPQIGTQATFYTMAARSDMIAKSRRMSTTELSLPFTIE
jgi:hypothetical protein